MISLAITNYNRTDLLFESIAPFLNDERIDEIVISDDHSMEKIFDEVCEKYKDNDKVQIFRNTENLDCYRNKRQAVKRATNDYVLLLDSDNIFTVDFIDKIFERKEVWEPCIALAPCWAKPHFNFTELSGKTISKENVASLLNVGSCSTMLNAMNYFVNRDEYLRVWDGSIDPVTSDSLYQNYNWLNGGNSIYVVPNLTYEHRVHSGSHYQNNVRRTPQGFHDSIIEKLTNMK
jgi:glycosyltransferase involved in cell wall biosynthesis